MIEGTTKTQVKLKTTGLKPKEAPGAGDPASKAGKSVAEMDMLCVIASGILTSDKTMAINAPALAKRALRILKELQVVDDGL